MYSLEIREHVDRIFKKLARKDPDQRKPINRRVQDMQEDPHRFKPMHFPLGGIRRANPGSSSSPSASRERASS